MGVSIRVGDQVEVVAGKRSRKAGEPTRGKVTSVDRAKGVVTVEGHNVRTKHLKRSASAPQGGRIRRELPVAISNVMLVAADGKTVRLARAERGDDGSIVRRPDRGAAAERS